MIPKILIADDEAPICRLLRRVLARYEVLVAATGDEALKQAREAQPDLILLDVHLPGKDGLEVLAELRGDSRTRLVPVIIVTSDAEPDDCVRGLDQGADGYVVKPFNPTELSARVDSLLRRARSDLAANPLTRLPGSPSIEEEVSRRLAAGKPFAFLYADIDRFKAYNDAHGYAQGDEVIRETAELLAEAAAAEPAADAFIGHVGGDDFVLICATDSAERVARHATALFDRAIRSGPSLSIGGVMRSLTRYGNLVRIAAEVKARLKARPAGGSSAFAFDRAASGPDGRRATFGPGCRPSR